MANAIGGRNKLRHFDDSPPTGLTRGLAKHDRRACRHPPATADRRTRAHQDVSIYPLTSDRVSLPASADLLRICRCSARPVWPLGRRLDDARAAVPLSPLWNVRARFRAAITAATRALVSAMALWTMARNERRRANESVNCHRRIPVLGLAPRCGAATSRVAASLSEMPGTNLDTTRTWTR